MSAFTRETACPRFARDPSQPARAVAALFVASALALLSGCLGSGTRRVDASCREMRSAVVYEMLKDNPTMHLLDLRRSSEITEQEGRLPGAQAFPLEELSARSALLQAWRESTIVVFGNDGETGRRGCQLLSSHGFKFVIFISDGAIGWFRNRLPAARSGGSQPAGKPAQQRDE